MKHNSAKNVFFSIAVAVLFAVIAIVPSAAFAFADNLTIADPFEGYTRYEAEDGDITRADIEKSYGTFSGQGFVAQIDYGNSGIAFKVECAEDGEYNMMLAYAIDPTFANAVFRISNDAGYYTQVTCDKKFGWGAFSRDAIAYCTISLKAGINTISVKKAMNFAQIDFIGIGARIGDYVDKSAEAQGFPLPEGYTRYEAEDGYVVNASAVGKRFYSDYGTGYSGGGFVGALDSTAQYVDIPVKVEESGTYSINLRYATESEGGAAWKIYVGRYGVEGYLYYYASAVMRVESTWGMFVEEALVSVDVAIEAGESFIRVLPDYNSAELDYIEIGPKKGEYYQGVTETVTGGGNNQFDDDFFAEDEGDGYVKKTGCNGAMAYELPVLAALLILVAVYIILWRKKDEKTN